ncbi:uncharacterized protein [Miscanthus floridulus]|uniref:uncharacterized protein isoform X1 n=1 Tax=Miscanthus floridulus TaxID=154761 RepID=UPI00345A4916
MKTEKRQAKSARIRDKYPDRIPVIVEKAGRTDVPKIDEKTECQKVITDYLSARDDWLSQLDHASFAECRGMGPWA